MGKGQKDKNLGLRCLPASSECSPWRIRCNVGEVKMNYLKKRGFRLIVISAVSLMMFYPLADLQSMDLPRKTGNFLLN